MEVTDSKKHSSLLRLGVRKFYDTGSWSFYDGCMFDIIVEKTYHGHSIDFMLCSVRFHSRFDQILNSFLMLLETCLF